MPENVPFDLLGDLPRGRSADHIGKPPNSHFARPEDIAVTQSMRMDPVNNREGKLFLGVVGGQMVQGAQAYRWSHPAVGHGRRTDRSFR